MRVPEPEAFLFRRLGEAYRVKRGLILKRAASRGIRRPLCFALIERGLELVAGFVVTRHNSLRAIAANDTNQLLIELCTLYKFDRAGSGFETLGIDAEHAFGVYENFGCQFPVPPITILVTSPIIVSPRALVK